MASAHEPQDDLRRRIPIGKPGFLSDGEVAFVAQYLNCFNPRIAALRAKLIPDGMGRERAWQVGTELLRRPHVRDYVDRQLANAHAKADEVLQQLSRVAFADLAQLREVLVPVAEVDVESGEQRVREPRPDEILERAEALGVSGLIKGLKRTAHGIELELHDAQRALEMLARHHKLVGSDVSVPLTGEIVVDLRVRGGDQEALPPGDTGG